MLSSPPSPSSNTPPNTTPPLLRLVDVDYCFATQTGQLVEALTGINLQVYPGDRIALIGPSGAGKSTLLRLLNGTLFATRGEVWAFERNFAQLSSRQRRRVQQQIGTVYQQFHLVNPLRVIHNVNAGQLGHWPMLKALWSLAVPQGIAEARAALGQVGIPDKLWARTDQLSGGQQQRVAIARVLLQKPAVVLADEPIASLDPERSREVMELLVQLCCEQNSDPKLAPSPGHDPAPRVQAPKVQAPKTRALVVSLHDVERARAFCDRIIGLRRGRIVFDQPTDQLTPEQVKPLYEIDPA